VSLDREQPRGRCSGSVFKRPTVKVLEGMVRLSQDPFFQEIMNWVYDSSKEELDLLVTTGDDVVRGHCQTLQELIRHVHDARNTLETIQQTQHRGVT